MNIAKIVPSVYILKNKEAKVNICLVTFESPPLEKKKFECPFTECVFTDGTAKDFPTKHQLNQHLHKVHAEKHYICSKCGKKFGHDTYRKHHEETCGQTWTCNCGNSYTIREALLTHCRRHQHEVPASAQRRKKSSEQTAMQPFKPPPQPPPTTKLTARVVPMVLVLEVNGKPTASESRAPVGPVQKATVATQTSAPSQRSTEVQTPKRPKLKLATKTQNWAANLIPAETQTWRILTPAETQTLPVLNQAETWPNSFASSTEPGSWPDLTESQSWPNPAAGTQTWPNQKPLDSQTWPNMTSEETRPLQNLIPAETQTMERFTPIPPQTLQGLTPRAAQSLQDLISAQTQSLQDLITSTRENIRDLIATQAQVLQNLIPEKDHIEWQSLCEQGSDPWLASIHTQTPGPLPAQTQTSWEEDALAAGLLVDDNPLPFLGEEDFITLMDTETQTAPDLSHSACQTLEELFPNI